MKELKKPLKLRNKGFTIIELLIATAILSTILVVVTSLMTRMGNLYFKGVNQTKTQNATRQAVNDISQRLKLSAGSPYFKNDGKTATGVLCVGTTRYSYVIGKKLATSSHVLWRDTIGASASASDCNPVNMYVAVPSAGGVELANTNARLFLFKLSSTNFYKLEIGLAYGDNDLLCAPVNVPGSCDTTAAMPNNPADYQTDELICKGKTGDQFCATARSETTIVQRVSGG